MEIVSLEQKREEDKWFIDPESGVRMHKDLWYIVSDSGSAYHSTGFVDQYAARGWLAKSAYASVGNDPRKVGVGHWNPNSRELVNMANEANIIRAACLWAYWQVECPEFFSECQKDMGRFT